MKDPKVEENKIDVVGYSSTQDASQNQTVFMCILKLLKISSFKCYIS